MKTSKWVDYKGEREKTEYDIMLHCGRIISPCWPNSYSFHSLDEESKGEVFHDDQVAKIRRNYSNPYLYGD